MAIAFDTASGSHTTTATSITWAHTCTGTDRILFVGYRCGAAGAVTGITYAGVAMTRVASEVGAANVGLFYLINPASGANNVVISLGSSQFISGISSSYTGAKQTGQPDSSNTRNASGTTSGNISTTVVAPNSWTISVQKAASSAITGGTNATERADGDNSEMNISDSNGPLAAGSQTMQMTSAVNATWNQVIASFSPFVPDSGGSPIFFGNTAIA